MTQFASGKVLKFGRGLQPGYQPAAQQPGRCAMNPVLMAGPFRLVDSGIGAAVGKSDVQGEQVDIGVGGQPVDDCLIVDVFTESEVCFEQLVVDLGEGFGLIAADPFSGG